MLITTRLFAASFDVEEAMRQTVDAFGAVLARLGDGAARFEKIGELAFHLAAGHPVYAAQAKGRASYSRDSGIFFTEAYLEYGAWIGDAWADRVAAVARAVHEALAAVHKTRLSVVERAAVSRMIDDVSRQVAGSPPGRLACLKPVYAVEDENGGMVSMGFQPAPASRPVSPEQRVIELQPEDVEAYVRRQRRAAKLAGMIKLHKRQEGRLLYREAWFNDGKVIEHAGVCGERGVISEHAAIGPARQREVMEAIAAGAMAEGFRAIPEGELVGLLVGKAISGMGMAADLRHRHALEHFLDEVTGWHGLGHCDGGSIGSGSMEARCLVVDGGMAAKVIERELASSPFKDFRVIRTEP